MPEITHALFRLGRELRYLPLPIIGQRVVIETLDAVEHVLRQLATPWITRESVWDGCDIEGGLAKYGLVDRWCTVDPRMLAGTDVLRGVPALRANGFSRREPEPDPEEEAQMRGFEQGCLLDLSAELGPCVLKLFLNDGLPDELRFQHNHDRYRAGLMPELLPSYFPRGFIVTDACITNAQTIWLGKHFYL
jgi:hypothetical protein